MTGPGLFQAFFSEQPQGFAHAVVHVHRSRVVINTIAAPIVIEQRDIEVPIGHFALAAGQLLLGPWTHREGT